VINIGVIGAGHWGPNHIRIFSQLSQSKVLMCADLSQDRLNFIKGLFPHLQITTNHKEILNNPDISAVVIAAPTSAHYGLAKEALNAGKHVFCEKPLALTTKECTDLRDLAKGKKLTLMVGHVFIFNAAITWLKECIRLGELGKIFYAYSIRTNLGPFRYDVNALWDLASHDISIFNYLFDSTAINASARGQKILGKSHEDLAFSTLEYPDNKIANIHVSWLDPKKVRQITIVGDKKMVQWDDLDNLGPIRLYDKHVEKTSTFYATYGEFQLLSKEGNIMIPNINLTEPLKTQAQYFLDCISKGQEPILSDAQKGLDVVKTLEALQQSMDRKGESVLLK
jgi:predicted dehydrogenase